MLPLSPNDISIELGMQTAIEISPISSQTLFAGDITHFLENQGSLVLETQGDAQDGNIILQSDVVLGWMGSNSLTLIADQQIIFDANAQLTPMGGSLFLRANSITTTSNSVIGGVNAVGDITLIADILDIRAAQVQSTGNLVIQPLNTNTSIGLGNAAPGTLNLDDIELSNIATGFNHIQIGDAQGTGTITLTSNLNFNTALTLSAGALDVAVEDTAQLSIATEILTLDTDLNIDIQGTQGATEYDQLQVMGEVHLNNTAINLDFSAIPSIGDSFTLIDNDGSEQITGQFAGLTEGSTLAVGSEVVRLSYHGGDGNDVTLETVSQIGGSSGRDRITGTTASEVITGGLNRDYLTGGGGHDTFVYTNPRDRVDYIRDFATHDQAAESDKIDLRPLFTQLGIETTDPIADGYIRVIDGARSVDIIQLDIDGALGSSRFRTFIQVNNANSNFANLNHSENFLYTEGGNVELTPAPTISPGQFIVPF